MYTTNQTSSYTIEFFDEDDILDDSSCADYIK